MARDTDTRRRSFVEDRLADLTFGKAIGNLALADFSLRPRFGVKGVGALTWLKGRKFSVPEENNQATKSTGRLVARLSPSEALILAESGRNPIPRFEKNLPLAGKSGAYPLPRADTHAWFRIAGSDAPSMFAKLCAIDFRAKSFANLAVAQTLAAQVSVIIIRDDLSPIPAFHLLADSASALYLWDCLADAMAEFAGVVLRSDDMIASPK